MAALTLSEKLDQLDARYQEMTQELSTPEVVTDTARFQKLAKQHADLEAIVNKHREFKQIEKDLAGAHQMVVESEDAEMRHMAQEEEKLLAIRKEQTERELKLLLLPHDPIDDKNIILEIRAGTGGDEAGIFAGDLFRMYSRYAELKRWQVEVIDSNESGIGGFIVLRDGQGLAKVPEKPVGKFGRALFQSMTYHDTPSQPLPQMRYVDTSAKAGEKHGYSIVSVNSVGLKSQPSAAASVQ